MKKQKLIITVETDYSKSVVSKIKKIFWNHFDINPNVVNHSFEDALNQELCFFFVSNDETFNKLKERIKFGFGEVLESIS
ncbi:hypothetical protein [Enterococcus dispar]|uniref:hypothetical protein n=1 Tax=Enterococcus dispar TaxID=44009 RepID=UPI0021D4547C|nr:hypothetical protein [Enterococcus dispar]MCU7356829.1 hypothetical protein [Enterococcus dispar]MDT2704930.1 hypothetical protein [Enterococcus dispar]